MSVPDKRWQIAYWIDDPNDPVPAPYWAGFDHLEEAVMCAKGWAGAERLTWMKIYPTDDERDVRARWTVEQDWHQLSRTAARILDFEVPA